MHSCGTAFSYACRLRKQTLDQLATTSAILDEGPARDLYQPDFAVDAVYTWVDGSEPHWLEQKEFYARELEKADKGSGRSDYGERFRIAMNCAIPYAPWRHSPLGCQNLYRDR